MTPQAHYQLLKQALYTPAPPPTMADVAKNRSWLGQHAGEVAGGAVGLGAALAPASMGITLPVGIGIGALASGAGWLWDKWHANKAMGSATNQWRQDEQQKENQAVHDGSMYGLDPNSKAGFIAGGQDVSRELMKNQPAPQFPTVTPPGKPLA